MLDRLPLIFICALCTFVLLFSACKTVKQTKEKCQEDEESCEGNMVNICLDGKWHILEDCSSPDMTCQMISGSAQCMESGGDADTEMDSAIDDSEIGTDVEKVVGEPTASICDCVSKILESEFGLDWMRDSCVANIDESCLSCLDEKAGGGDCAVFGPAATALALVECADSCPRSLTTLTDKNQCMATILLSDMNLPGLQKDRELFAECFCSECFSSMQKCLSGQTCAAALACLVTPRGITVDPESEQATPCSKVFETISLSDEEEISAFNGVGECIASSEKCYGYLGYFPETN